MLRTFEAWQDPATWEALEPEKTLKSPEGEEVKPHSGSIPWNSYRGKWVTVFVQIYGDPTMLGEVWYAEADSPLALLPAREYRLEKDSSPTKATKDEVRPPGRLALWTAAACCRREKYRLSRKIHPAKA